MLTLHTFTFPDGRNSRIVEDRSISESRTRTKYTYDALGNLRCVEQHGGVAGNGASCTSSGESLDSASPWRMRRFTYDSLSRLTRAKNPESGIINYAYNDDGLVTSKTDARGITSNYDPADSHIDPLHRVTKKTYSNNDPAVTYSYDQGLNGIGRRTGMTDASGASSWTYDEMGRPLVVNRTITGIPTKSITYTYNIDGSVASIRYPSNRLVTYVYNAQELPILAHDSTLGVDVVNSVSYTPTGALASAKLGTNITLSYAYNNRLQPTTISASSGTNTLMSRTYDFHWQNGDNGNVYGITDNLDSLNIPNRPVGSQVFTYDGLNRLAQANSTGTDCTSMSGTKNWGNTYTIDPWGNLTNKGAVSGMTGCTGELLNEPVASANRFMPSEPATPPALGRFDAAGNMIQFGAYTFDAESRISTASSGTYSFIYDGDGNRVKKLGGVAELHWIGADSETLAESDASGVPNAEYLFFGSRRVARIDRPTEQGAVPIYYISDHLGSATVLGNADGTSRGETMYFPYGGERWSSLTDSNHYKFTGKQRDSETQLDYFGARHYSWQLGRWVSPDWSSAPATVPYGQFSNPQSLNLFAYHGNNPLSGADSNGHCWPFCEVAIRVAEVVSSFVARHPDVADAAQKVLDSGSTKASLGVGVQTPKSFPVAGSGTATVYLKGSKGGLGTGVNLNGSAKVVSVGGQANVDVPVVQNGQFVNPLKSTTAEVTPIVGGGAGKVEIEGSAGKEDATLGGTYGEGVVGGMEVSTTMDSLKELTTAVVDGLLTDIRDTVTNAVNMNGMPFHHSGSLIHDSD